MSKGKHKRPAFTTQRVKNHDPRHDPQLRDVKHVLKELRICKNQRKRKVKRGKREITYEVFESSELKEWTVFGFTKSPKERKSPGRVSGFLMIIRTDSKLVKTFYEFGNRHPGFVEGKVRKFKSYRPLEPKDFPDLEIGDVKLLRTQPELGR